MPDYDTLDNIADAFIPIIFGISLIILVYTLFGGHRKLFYHQAILLLAGAIVAYGLMAIDAQFEFWPTLGLDYSTHTAVALVLTVFLCATLQKKLSLLLVLFLSYLLLMLYQKYHSFADIITTIVVVSLVYSPWVIHYIKRLPSIATPASAKSQAH